MKRLIVALAAMAALVGCSSSGKPAAQSGSPKRHPTTSAPHTSAPHGIVIYHNGYALPACSLGIGPAPCQRTVSPVQVQFATPTPAGQGGGYDVELSGDSITVTEYVDARQLEACPSNDGYPCLSDDHHVTDQAGTWEIRF